MRMIDDNTLERLLDLPADERLALAERLWDSLARIPEAVPIPDWHREIIDERSQTDLADSNTLPAPSI